MGQAELESLAERVDKLNDAAAVAEKWSSTIDSGFAM